MTANESKSYLGYLNKLVDEYNNTNHRSIDKKPIDIDYSALMEDIKSSIKLLNLKLLIGSGLQITRIFLAKVVLRHVRKKYLWLILCSKLILGCIKLKI